jgi:hypothetical protein
VSNIREGGAEGGDVPGANASILSLLSSSSSPSAASSIVTDDDLRVTSPNTGGSGASNFRFVAPLGKVGNCIFESELSSIAFVDTSDRKL